MARAIKFDDLFDKDEAEKQEAKKKQDLEINIEVAGAKETEAKTIVVKMDIFGLLHLSFKEGGQLPGCLTGKFTSIDEVRSALDIWRNERHHEFVVAPEIKRQAEAQAAPEPSKDPEKVQAPEKKSTLSLNK